MSVTKPAGPASAPGASAPPAALPAPPEPTPPAAASAEAPVQDLGDWVDSASYKLKVSALKRCGGDAVDDAYRLGVGVQVFSKYDELLVASRDVKLESGGIILDSEINPKPSPNCAPLLATKQLRHDQTLSGVVVFTIPKEFDTRKAVVTYQATRWGGAPQVRFKVPACFDACDGKKLAGPKK